MNKIMMAGLTVALLLPVTVWAGIEDWTFSVVTGQNDGIYEPDNWNRFEYYVNPNLGHVHLTEAYYRNNVTEGWTLDTSANHVVFGRDAERGPNSQYPRWYYYGDYSSPRRWGYAEGSAAAMQWFSEEEFEARFTFTDPSDPDYADAVVAHDTLLLAWRDRFNEHGANLNGWGRGPNHDEL